jgi:hypothetical protein
MKSSIIVGTCLDPFASLINHSCIPNADWSFEGNTFQLRANQTIKSNDEIFITYTGLVSLEGHKQLQEFWGFNCCCRQCMEGYPQITEKTQTLLEVLDEIQSQSPNQIAPVEAVQYAINEILGYEYGVDTTSPIIRRLQIKIYEAQIAGKEYEEALKTILKLCFGPYILPSNRQRARITALKGLLGMMETCLEIIQTEIKSGCQLNKWFEIDVHVLETVYHHFRTKLLVDTDKCFGANSAVAKYEKRLYKEKFPELDGISWSPEQVAEILDMMNELLAWLGVQV